MTIVWKLGPQVLRVLLVLAATLFAFLGLKYFNDPVGTTAVDSISLASPAGITDMRVVGAVFLACGLTTVFTLLSPDRVLSGLRFVLTIVGTVTLARLYGFLVDGAPASTVTKLRTEVILVGIFAIGLVFETIRQRRAAGQSALGTRQ